MMFIRVLYLKQSKLHRLVLAAFKENGVAEKEVHAEKKKDSP